MARTVSLTFSVEGEDTTNISTSGNVSNRIELARPDKATTLLDSFNIEIAANTAATSIKSQAAALAGVTNVQVIIFVTYNSGEATPKVQVVVDAAATIANDVWAGIYTSTITLATTSLSNACTVQAFFYKAY